MEMQSGSSDVILRLKVLGGADAAVRSDGQQGRRLTTAKGLALLCYLAMDGGRPTSRATLADLLWGDRIDRQARQNLRQCLMSIRRDLGPAASLLVVDERSVALKSEAIEVDALQFLKCATAADLAERIGCLEISWGPFLDGFYTGADTFDEWTAAQRNAQAAIAVRTFSELAEMCEARGEGERAILAMERLVSIDPAEEERQRRLISLEARYRGPDAALARARSLIAVLKRELDSEPELATRALIDDLRRSAGTRSHSLLLTAAKAERSTDEAPPSRPHMMAQASIPTPNAGHFSMMRRVTVSAVVAGVFALAGVASYLHTTATRSAGDWVATDTAATPAIETVSPWKSPSLPSRRTPDFSAGRAHGIVAMAVLPFASHVEEGESPNLVADMVTDDLTNNLSRISSFRVISRQTSSSYRNRNVNVAAIGAELGVAYILEGSVSVRGSTLRVNAELVDAKTQLSVWSGRFNRTSDQRHRIQDEIVNSIGRELQIEITELESGLGSPAPNVHALIFKGWAAIATAGKIGISALHEAEGHFTRALALEPDNPQAQTGIGAYNVHMAIQLFAPDPAQHLSKAEEILTQVIARHPKMATAYQIMGALNYARGNRPEALLWFERTIEINPSQAHAYAQLGRVLVATERVEQGLEHILYAMRLSPRDPNMAYWLGYAGFAELELKHYDGAINYLEKAMALNPNQPRSLLTLVAAHTLAGNTVQAQQKLDQLQLKQPHLSKDKLVNMYFGSSAASRPPQMSEGLRLILARQ